MAGPAALVCVPATSCRDPKIMTFWCHDSDSNRGCCGHNTEYSPHYNYGEPHILTLPEHVTQHSPTLSCTNTPLGETEPQPCCPWLCTLRCCVCRFLHSPHEDGSRVLALLMVHHPLAQDTVTVVLTITMAPGTMVLTITMAPGTMVLTITMALGILVLTITMAQDTLVLTITMVLGILVLTITIALGTLVLTITMAPGTLVLTITMVHITEK
ncbi:uncharacterized protein LOC142844320 [Microtus pennsylvanicus]|uniref:uncharacterized protein LOC142844320 n=1 Tax=Microtus pennsylvanicus TaxID=10058 RepID=UPI003F6A924F